MGEKPWLFEPGQKPWNYGSGGCKKGHDPELYVKMPSGVFVCLGCKRENGAKYRESNRVKIRRNSRAARYKLELDFVLDMYQRQDKRCAICGEKIEFDNSRIDHDHKSGKVRGILCCACNTGIGLLKDSPEVLMNAAKYIESNYD